MSSDEVKGSKLRSFLSCLNIQSDYTGFNLSHLQTGIMASAANQVCPDGFLLLLLLIESVDMCLFNPNSSD